MRPWLGSTNSLCARSTRAIRHVVVKRNGRIFGALQINTRMWHDLAHERSVVTLGDVAQRNVTIVREPTAVFDVIRRMRRREAAMALVVSAETGRSPQRPNNVRGVITYEHRAAAVAETIKIYPR